MLQIQCPYCGARDETEFVFGGESHIVRPPQPDLQTDKQWADYVFYRENSKGLHRERWQHIFGCRQWFNIVRDTVSHQIHRVYKMDEAVTAVFQQPEETFKNV